MHLVRDASDTFQTVRIDNTIAIVAHDWVVCLAIDAIGGRCWNNHFVVFPWIFPFTANRFSPNQSYSECRNKFNCAERIVWSANKKE